MGRNVLLMLCLVSASPALADFAADQYPPYERCALCHGLFGVSHTGKFPNLAGQKPAYIQAQIDAFLSGARTNDGGQMAAIVTELKPEEIPVVVAWFSSQDPPAPFDTTGDGAAYSALGCADCHSDDESDAPYLSAQHAQYLGKQMEDFRDGRRSGSDITDVHKDLLQDAPIHEIAAYLAGTARP